MIIVHVMQMAVMQIVDVTLMEYCRMPAIGTVPVRMVRMMILVASGHLDFPFFLTGCRRLRFRHHARWHFPPNAGRECPKANNSCASPCAVVLPVEQDEPKKIARFVPDLDYLMASTRQCLLNQFADLSVCANQNNFHKNSILVSDLSLSLRWGSQLLSCSLCHVGSFRAATSIGIFRKRLPVAAKIALAMAGTIADVPVSPIPPGGSALLTMWTSMAGASFMRSIW